MATSNTTLTKSWVKVSEDTDIAFLITNNGTSVVEVVAMLTDTTPVGLVGHRLQPYDGIVRDLLGDGFVYMRVAADSSYDESVIVVSK